MKPNKINIFLIFVAFITFFFRVIPIPLNNKAGDFSGFLWTSVLYQLTVGNVLFIFLWACIFALLFYLNHTLRSKK